MERFNSYDFDASSLSTRYGVEENLKNKWKEIVAEKDLKARHKMIDEIIEEAEKNSEQNGFFSKKDIISINTMRMQGFKLDDKELYYTFFDNLEQFFNESGNDGISIVKSIIKTSTDYFGKLPQDAESLKNRDAVSKINYETEEFPSIKEFKEKDCAACVEYSSLAHNLWLLTGYKSYFVQSKDISFQDATNQDGHAFVIIEFENKQDPGKSKFNMFDITNNTLASLKGNPIEQMFKGEKLVVNNRVYSNSSVLEHGA